jgi:SNF2 family DNA or RNA helicase/HKD family nuclease
MVELIDNRLDDKTLANHLTHLLARAEAAYIHVAYLRVSGVALVQDALMAFITRAGRLHILAGGDFAQTEPNALQSFRVLGGDCEVKLVSSSGLDGFHPKCYPFYTTHEAALIVGSSNFTAGGLVQNIELNVRLDLAADHPAVVSARIIFDHLWNATPPLTDERLADYRRYWEACQRQASAFLYRLPLEEGKPAMPEATEPAREVQVGDTVSVNGQIGQVVSITQLGARLSVGVAIEGVGLRTILSPPTVLTVVDTPLSRVKKLAFDPPVLCDLLTEATRLSLAYEHDRLVSLSNSRAKLEPYQVAAVHKISAALEQRFLIADDVGLGKTVEAGMVMKELAARHRADKVLVIAPAGLVLQWQREMREKFDEVFERFTSTRLREWRSTRPAGETLSTRHSRVVVSLDTAKPREDENNSPDFTESHWDLVILDEAHKVEQHGVGEELTSRYKLARDIAPSCDSLLLLSATPHDGDPHAFHSLIELIDPFRFPNPEQVAPTDLEPIIVRRGKADIRKEDGSPLFPPRWVETTAVTFTQDELNLYNRVTDYVRDGYRTATTLKYPAVGFLMVLLQKRMVSSIAAIRKSLERRLIALEHPEAAALTPAELRELREREDDEEALSDERREQLQRKLERARLKLTTAEHREEIRRVKELLELAKRIRVDSKAQELRQFMRGLLGKAPQEKLLVFTEYTDTLDYLRDEVLSDFGPIAQIYGSMGPEERQAEEETFQQSNVHLMLATDAAGEGINLQFCHLMINYELPWNPNRIEQRIGRLHRYGQDREVRVYNMQVINTREGIILTRLLEKLKTIERQLGGYAPNILGLTTRDVGISLNRLSDLIMNAIAEDTPPEVTADHIEQVMEQRRRMYDQIESSLFMPLRHFDKGEADRVIARSHALTPSNADIDAFVRRYCDAHAGKIENTRQKGVVRIRTPRELMDGKTVLDEYARATFDKETAFRHKPKDVQFIAFGHPLLEMMIRHCRDQSGGLHGIACVQRLLSTTLRAPGGVLCNYTVRYADAHDHTFFEDLFPVFVSVDGETSLERGRALVHEIGEEVPNPQANDHVAQLVTRIDELEHAAQQAAAGEAERGYQRLQVEINRQADACLQSLEKFREAKRQRLQLSTLDYQQRLLFGEDMDIAIRRAQYELDRLDDECERRRRQIEERRHVQVHAPALLNVALLLT